MTKLNVSCLIVFLILHHCYTLDIIGDLGNFADAVNNKYNTFSLVEFIMDDLEDYMQDAYTELKKIVKKKIDDSKKLFGKGGNTPALIRTNSSANITRNKSHHNSSHPNFSSHTFSALEVNYSTRPQSFLRKQNNSSLGTLVGNRNWTHVGCSQTNVYGMKVNVLNQSRGHSTLLVNQTATRESVHAHNHFIDDFLHNKITKYYKCLHKKYANTSYYGAVKLIADGYFKQFKAELKRIRNNITTDIKEMATDLVRLYYETTTTTESLDSLLVHYVENKTHDLESYVKKFLHMKNTTSITQNHTLQHNLSSSSNNKTTSFKSRMFIQNQINLSRALKTSFIDHGYRQSYGRNNSNQMKAVLKQASKLQTNSRFGPDGGVAHLTKLPQEIKKIHS